MASSTGHSLGGFNCPDSTLGARLFPVPRILTTGIFDFVDFVALATFSSLAARFLSDRTRELLLGELAREGTVEGERDGGSRDWWPC